MKSELKKNVCAVELTPGYPLKDSANKLVLPFPRTNSIVLDTAAQPFVTAYIVTSENLVP